MASLDYARVWLITGSSQGLGSSIVAHLLANSQRVVATARNVNTLDGFKSKYSSDQLLVLRLDVTEPEEIDEVFAKTEEHFHRLDIVINNAGFGVNGEIEGTPEHVARGELETLFWGPVNIMKQAVRFFREVNPPGHGGRIFNMSSVAGYTGHTGIGFYSAGKFALEGLSESLRREMSPEWNISVVILEPGGFATNARTNATVLPIHPAYNSDSPSQTFLKMLGSVPFIGDPDKAAEIVLKLADHPNPPIRLPLGSVAWKVVVDAAKETLDEAEKWKAMSCSTDADEFAAGVGKDQGL